MRSIRTLVVAVFAAASMYAGSPAPKPVGVVGGIVMDSTITRASQERIERLLRSERVEAGKPVDSRQFLAAPSLIQEETEGRYSAVWRRAAGKPELTLYIERVR